MSSSIPPDGEFPFFDLSALLGGAQGRDPWKQAADMATAIASNNNTEPNLDPIQRMQVEDLARVAELQVSNAIGVSLPPSTRISAVTRAVWAAKSVEAYRRFFDEFGQALSSSMQTEMDGAGYGSGEPDSADIESLAESLEQHADGLGSAGFDPSSLFPPQLMAQMFAALGPMLVSSSAASMIGHLGQRALGQYDLPIPRPDDTVLVIPSTIDEKADEWDVDSPDLRLWVLIHELTAHATLSVPHVKSRLEALLMDFASAFRPNVEMIRDQLGDLSDPSRLNEMASVMNDPDMVLSMMRSPAQDLLVPQLDALVAVILGFVDYTVDQICSSLIPSHPLIRERIRERWIDVAPADRFMERLLGLEIDESTLNRGTDFINGVVARAGDDGLIRLWADELDLPTAAEVDAPGLWLARIGMGDDAGTAAGLDVPDDLSGLDDL